MVVLHVAFLAIAVGGTADDAIEARPPFAHPWRIETLTRQPFLAKASPSEAPTPATSAAWALVALPVVSSLDNFAVGAALGVAGHVLLPWTVVVVAIMNGVGMLLSCSFGSSLGGALGTVATVIAGGAFSIIGVLEMCSWHKGEDGLMDKMVKLAVARNAWSLGLPMTLNNLSAGVAGGLAGANIAILTLLTVAASFGLMYIGYLLGRLAGRKLPVDPRPAGGLAFLLLGLSQLLPSVQQAFGF